MSSLPSWLKAAWNSGWQVFVASVAVGVLGVIDELRDWQTTGDPPDLSAFGSIVIGAVLALATALVTAAYRAWRPPEVTYTDPPPTGP